MRKLTNTIDRTAEYVNFINNLSQFHAAKGTTLQVEPILGKKRLDLLKLFKIVMNIGGFDKVTQGRAWKQVGNQFGFPATCTNSAYILKGLYIRNLLGWEEEHVNGKVWKPPEELKGPHAHKLSTLAGNRYKKHVPGSTPKAKQKKMKGEQRITVVDSPQEPTYPLTPVSQDSPSYNNDTSAPITTTNDIVLEESVKQKILFSLRFGGDKDIDWALHFLLDLTFTTPQHLPISATPMLIELLLDQGRPYIKHQQKQLGVESKTSQSDALSSLMDMDDDDESTVKYDRLKKVLHVIRNYSTLEADAMAMATHSLLKDLLIDTLDLSTASGNSELGRYCVDIVEKMTAHIPLAGPGDPWIPCLTKLIYIQDPYMVAATIRALTIIGMCDLNQLFLANNTQVVACIAQNLLATDEEMVGVSLEYLYQQVCISAECKSQMLSAYNGAYVALLVEKVQSTSKYYVPKLIKEEVTTAATSPNSNFTLQPLSPSGSSSSSSSSGSSSGGGNSSTASSMVGGPTSSLSGYGNQTPSVPDLTNYSTLDEPFRCLGWLKDKFEVTDASNTLSLDDMYLLYYSRFGTEKALKMNHFYSVLTIAFPEESPTHIMENGEIIRNPSKTGTKIEGLCVKGLQIKMNILHDEVKSQYVCQWHECTNNIHNDQQSLDDHIVSDHTLTVDGDGRYSCQWIGCTTTVESKDGWITHIHGHAAETSPLTPTDDSSTQPSSLSTPTATPPSSSEHDNTGLQTVENDTNAQMEPATPISDGPTSELKGIPLVAIHLLRSLSEDPTASTYFAPYEIALINAADGKPPLSAFVYSILSNIRIHSAVTSPTSL